MPPSLDDYLHAKKLKITIGSFQFYCRLKNPSIWLDQRCNWPQPTKKWKFLVLISLDDFHAKKTKITWFFPQILMIKESDNLIEKEAWMATTSPEVVSHATFSWWLSPANNLWDWSIPSRDIDDQRTLESEWMWRTTGHIQPKVIASDATFPWWLTPDQKKKIVIDSFWRHWWSTNTAIRLDEWHNCSHSIRSVASYANFLCDYHYAKNLRYWLIPSRDIDDQRTLDTDRTRDSTGKTKPKKVVSDATFLWWLSQCKKYVRSIRSFQIYWWSKNIAIWLAGSISGYNWRARFLQNHEEL